MQQHCTSITFFTKNLGDVGVVHIRAGLQDLPSLVLGPDHEGVHRTLDVVLVPGLAGLLWGGRGF